MAPLFPPRADPRFTTVTSDSTVNKLIEQGYNVHCGSTPTVFSRPVLSSQRETVSMTHICSTVRVVAHIMTDAPWWRIGYGSWTGGLGVVWGEDGTEAAQQNLAEKSPFASNQTENPTLWVAMIRALETAPDGVDIEIRLTRAYREDRGHQKDECPYHVFSMMSPGWVSQWQTNGWTRSSYYGGGPVRYQDLIKYLLFLEEKRTGNVFYVYVDGKELDEEEIEGENNRGFEAAKVSSLPLLELTQGTGTVRRPETRPTEQ